MIAIDYSIMPYLKDFKIEIVLCQTIRLLYCKLKQEISI
jgi:hypothetical protein